MDEPSDGQLLAAWTAGDARAFEALVDRHQAALLRHARALLGDGVGVEDAVQEAFLRLAQRPPELPEGVRGDREAERSVLGAWLHRVMRNLAMDTLRGESRRRAREEVVAPDEADAGGLDHVEAEDTRRAVELGIERLAPDQREVIVLRLFGEKSYSEIAEITGKKTGTVGWLLSVGMKALAKELGPLLGSGLGATRPPRVAGASLEGGRS